MELNEKKIAFIICSNNELFLEECLMYISRLKVPEGIEVEQLVVYEAKSMLSGMQEGKESTDAKYKVFLHQDVFIINRNFIYDVINIFNSDKKIGLIGMVGTQKMPENFVMWYGPRKHYLYPRDCNMKISYDEYNYSIEDGIDDVVAVDGLLMATAYDIDLRTDIFDGWDFYDVSTSIEYQKNGYRVVVPNQKRPWCIHEDGRILTLWNYNKYRKIAISEYKDILDE